MSYLKVPTIAEWQAFLDTDLKLKVRQAEKIRSGLLLSLDSAKKASASAIHSLWSDVVSALKAHAAQLPLEAGEEPPDGHTLTTPDHITEAVSDHLEGTAGENHHSLLARAYAVTGLFKLFEAQQWAMKSSDNAVAESVIDAAILECEAIFLRERGIRTAHEHEMATAIAITKSKHQKAAEKKNAKNRAWRADVIVAYENYKKSLTTKLNMSKAAEAILMKLPKIEVDQRAAYEWIREHEAAKKPKKVIEHL